MSCCCASESRKHHQPVLQQTTAVGIGGGGATTAAAASGSSSDGGGGGAGGGAGASTALTAAAAAAVHDDVANPEDSMHELATSLSLASETVGSIVADLKRAGLGTEAQELLTTASIARDVLDQVRHGCMCLAAPNTAPRQPLMRIMTTTHTTVG